MTEKKPLHVSIIGLPEATHSTVAGLADVFNCFGELGGLNDAMPLEPPFNAVIVSDDDSHESPALFKVQATISDIQHTDIIVIPSLSVSPFDWQPGGHDDMVTWLLQMKSRGAMLCSACSGALLLAQTGMLDNYRATTHWAYAELFQQLFPAIDLCPEQLLMTTGDNDSILMSGSAGSWHDLALYLITQYVSLAAAQTISKFMLLEWHPDGLLPYMMFMPKRKHGDAIILQAQDWLENNIDAANPVDTITESSGLSARTFKRRFTQATGFTPIHYMQKCRVEVAKQKLERTDLPIDEIAWQVGYRDPAFFRRLFKRLNGVTAGAHRRKLRMPGLALAANG